MIRRVSFMLLLCCVFARPALAQQAPSPRQELQTGTEVYQNACMACHGPDGRGNPQSVVGFARPLPDFSDCLFVTVEEHRAAARAAIRVADDDGDFAPSTGSRDVRNLSGHKRSTFPPATAARVTLTIARIGRCSAAVGVAEQASPHPHSWAHNLSSYEATEPKRFVNDYGQLASASSTVLARSVASTQ